jgi:hypothetical protein
VPEFGDASAQTRDMSWNFRGLLMVGKTMKPSTEVHDGNESATTGGKTQHS